MPEPSADLPKPQQVLVGKGEVKPINPEHMGRIVRTFNQGVYKDSHILSPTVINIPGGYEGYIYIVNLIGKNELIKSIPAVAKVITNGDFTRETNNLIDALQAEVDAPEFSNNRVYTYAPTLYFGSQAEKVFFMRLQSGKDLGSQYDQARYNPEAKNKLEKIGFLGFLQIAHHEYLLRQANIVTTDPKLDRYLFKEGQMNVVDFGGVRKTEPKDFYNKGFDSKNSAFAALSICLDTKYPKTHDSIKELGKICLIEDKQSLSKSDKYKINQLISTPVFTQLPEKIKIFIYSELGLYADAKLNNMLSKDDARRCFLMSLNITADMYGKSPENLSNITLIKALQTEDIYSSVFDQFKNAQLIDLPITDTLSENESREVKKQQALAFSESSNIFYDTDHPEKDFQDDIYITLRKLAIVLGRDKRSELTQRILSHINSYSEKDPPLDSTEIIEPIFGYLNSIDLEVIKDSDPKAYCQGIIKEKMILACVKLAVLKHDKKLENITFTQADRNFLQELQQAYQDAYDHADMEQFLHFSREATALTDMITYIN